MVIKMIDDSLARYQKMVRRVADEYLDHLNNQLLFKSKLFALIVWLFPASTKNSTTVGFCENGKKSGLTITLFIKEDDPDDYVAFTIAHQFAHLLLIKMTDILYYSGKMPNHSTELTAITRVTEDGEKYGFELEERLADIISLYIIENMGYLDYSDTLRVKLKKSQNRRIIVEQLVNAYGKSLMECKKIDEYEEENGKYHVSNDFLYAIVTFSLVDIISSYERNMGENSWFIFCDALDNYKKKGNIELARSEATWLLRLFR